MVDMNDKVVTVTGATGGQGEAEVRLLVACGAQVVFGGRNKENGRAIKADLSGRAIFERTMSASKAKWAAIVERAEQAFGGVTGLVNNAGVTSTDKMTEIEEETVMAGIRVNLVNPGPIDTPMIGNVVGKLGAWGLSKIVPLGRIGEAEDVARAVVFLPSDDASFITGAELNVDGGRTVAPAGLL